MKIYLGADHNGFALKNQLVSYLQHAGHEVVDLGNDHHEAEDDYPQFAGAVAMALLADDDATSRGILVCGSGQGVCIAANRFRGIRAAVALDIEEARTIRNDEDGNVLCLPARRLTLAEAEPIINVWLRTPFAAASRYKRRIRELDELSNL